MSKQRFKKGLTHAIEASEAEELGKYREAGCKLAEAAMRVVRTYDGVHRLSAAVAEWNQTVANEVGRPHGKEQTLDREVGGIQGELILLTKRVAAIEKRVLADGHSRHCPRYLGAAECTCGHDELKETRE